MRIRAWLAVMTTAVALVVAVATRADAAARVDVGNEFGTAAIDSTYATTLTLSGSGFQSIDNGHGGIYVFFGTVSGTWQPSRGGLTGVNYLYVPDSESRDNQGFQKFVAFPGSDTAGAANGGTISADGTWSTTIVVPGAVFEAVDRDGNATTVDCRQVTCGIITIGAHGVQNANNESFTPVDVADLYADGSEPSTPSATDSAGSGQGAGQGGQDGRPRGQDTEPSRQRPRLKVDNEVVTQGAVLTFSAHGLQPGDQVVASLDDGQVTVGPLVVGPSGQLAGAMRLPPDLGAGTHSLALVGAPATPTVSFPVREAAPAGEQQAHWWPKTATALAAAVLMAALVFGVRSVGRVRRRVRHAASSG